MELDYDWWRNNTEECPPASEQQTQDKDVLSHQPSAHAGFENDEGTYFKFRKEFACDRLDLDNIDPPIKKKKKFPEWRYIQYIPEWTDPAWQDPSLYESALINQKKHGEAGEKKSAKDGDKDEDKDKDKDEGKEKGKEKEKGEKKGDEGGKKGEGRPIRHIDILRAIRPAQLAKDAARNPTPFARRFGIHPERTDGRSQLSPTSDVRRQLPLPEGSNRPPMFVKATAALEQLKALAREHGRDPEELLQELTEPATFARLGKNDQFMVQFLQGIYDDYDWQSIIFGTLTTDEMMRDGIFTIDNQFPGPNIDVPLHKLVQRQRWQRLVAPGMSMPYPQYMYNIGGRKGVIDPGTDDFVWERLQPALRLVTKILNECLASNNQWRAFMNVFCRERINMERDTRPYGQIMKRPAWSFSTNKIDPDNLPGFTEEVAPYIDAMWETWITMHRSLIIMVKSAFHKEGYAQQPRTTDHIAGLMSFRPEYPPRTLNMSISADIIYPLLAKGYSVSEQVDCQFRFVNVFLHELAHSVTFSHMMWTLCPGPRSHGPFKARQPFKEDTMDNLERFGKAMWGEGEPFAEPYTEAFGDDLPVTEAGSWMERMLFGGSSWTTSSLGHSTRFLKQVPCGVVLYHYPYGYHYYAAWSALVEKDARKNVLASPPLSMDQYNTTVRSSQLQAFFNQKLLDRRSCQIWLLGPSPSHRAQRQGLPQGHQCVCGAHHCATWSIQIAPPRMVQCLGSDPDCQDICGDARGGDCGGVCDDREMAPRRGHDFFPGQGLRGPAYRDSHVCSRAENDPSGRRKLPAISRGTRHMAQRTVPQLCGRSGEVGMEGRPGFGGDPSTLVSHLGVFGRPFYGVLAGHPAPRQVYPGTSRLSVAQGPDQLDERSGYLPDVRERTVADERQHPR
ncbi:hypothetical protein SODALDRAFT_3173 [Sodiomyces alkalinus F11]|uniref:Uncharacterized protein n=1 Tax=Sodiomyces alkalinus (strain CBS 110278 / VKM F-3762 / F11) TaxID=1314773 RepID=A0A3N2Q5E0_SODAK|nr:hypothetical protein SODALDRAFT_3173 [Sodiomyces alkalinus F11]ROT41916.1 hypothetical protein SODALDRAFT_3173 [Sodiomyces alkalinus F11]